MKITVTWTNGQKETYDCKSWVVEESKLLWLEPQEYDIHTPSEPARCIPLRNVQIWTLIGGKGVR
jgi:hypothetical protein